MLSPILAALWADPTTLVVVGVAVVVGIIALIELAGLRVIPNDRVGVIEKLWSPKGSVTEGRIIALSARPGIRRTCFAAASISACGAGSTASTRSAW